MKSRRFRGVIIFFLVSPPLWLGAQCVQDGRPPADGAARKEAHAKARAELDKRIQVLRSEYEKLDAYADTPGEIGKALGHDPGACARFLQRRLRYEPYPGVLRGARGALGSGAGNSADRCLLLREMLLGAQPAPRMRFLRARISAGDARRLIEASLETLPDAAVVLQRTASAAEPGLAPAAPADRAEPPVLREEAAETRQLLEDAASDRKMLAPFLFLAAAPAPPAISPVALESARDHFWLQVEQRGAWESFDPTAGLLAPKEGASVSDEMPAEVVHSAALKIDVERLEGKELRRETLIERKWSCADLAGKAVEVVLVPENFSLSRLLNDKSPANPVIKEIDRFEKFGVLAGVTGGTMEGGRAFDLDGRTSTAPSKGFPGGTVDPFGRTGRGKPKPEKAELAGVWMTFTLSSPGSEPRILERPLLDRVAPASRAAKAPRIAGEWLDPKRVKMALIQRTQAVVSGGAVGATHLAREALDGLVKRPNLERALALCHGVYCEDPTSALSELPELPADLIAMGDGALSLVQARMAGVGMAFLARPNLVLRRESLELRAPGELRFVAELDIQANDVEALGDPPAQAEARAMHGILLSEMEGRSPRAEPGRWAANILRAAQASDTPLRRIEKVSDLETIHAGADVKAIMARDLERSFQLLAPERPVEVASAPRMAWWRVDRAGNVTAVGSDGTGQAASEGLFVLKEISIPMVKRCARFVACLNKAIAGGGSLNGAGAECLSAAIKDIVKESVDKAIDEFIKDPLKEKLTGAATGMFGEEYEKLIKKAVDKLASKAEKAFEKKDGGKKAEGGGEGGFDPGKFVGAGVGINDGKAAAGAGKEIGSLYATKIFLLLAMGRDIADYASSH